MSDDHENSPHQHNKIDTSILSSNELKSLFGDINELVNSAKKDLLNEIIRPDGWKVDWNIAPVNFQAFKKGHILKFTGQVWEGRDPKLEIAGISHTSTGGADMAEFGDIPPNLVVKEDGLGIVRVTTEFNIKGHGEESHPHEVSFHFNRIGENSFSLQFFGADVGSIPVSHHDTGGGYPD